MWFGKREFLENSKKLTMDINGYRQTNRWGGGGQNYSPIWLEHWYGTNNTFLRKQALITFMPFYAKII